METRVPIRLCHDWQRRSARRHLDYRKQGTQLKLTPKKPVALPMAWLLFVISISMAVQRILSVSDYQRLATKIKRPRYIARPF
jgi:hypothetical protein